MGATLLMGHVMGEEEIFTLQVFTLLVAINRHCECAT